VRHVGASESSTHTLHTHHTHECVCVPQTPKHPLHSLSQHTRLTLTLHSHLHLHSHTHTHTQLKTHTHTTLTSQLAQTHTHNSHSHSPLTTQDDSQLRRGIPVTHSIFGVASTINSANYMMFVAMEVQPLSPVCTCAFPLAFQSHTAPPTLPTSLWRWR